MIKTIIFDMNGVIINDHVYQKESWRIFLLSKNMELTEAEYKEKISGRLEKEIFANLFGRELSDEELERECNKRQQIAIDLFKPNMKLVDVLQEFLGNAKSSNIPMGVATLARRKYSDFILDGFDIRKYFRVVMNGQDIEKGKPDPEIYIKVAAKFEVDPGECLVYEDSTSGIKAAKNAGMVVVRVATTQEDEGNKLADDVIKDFKGLDPKELFSRFNSA